MRVAYSFPSSPLLHFRLPSCFKVTVLSLLPEKQEKLRVKLENRSVSRTNTKLTYHVEDSVVVRKRKINEVLTSSVAVIALESVAKFNSF